MMLPFKRIKGWRGVVIAMVVALVVESDKLDKIRVDNRFSVVVAMTQVITIRVIYSYSY